MRQINQEARDAEQELYAALRKASDAGLLTIRETFSINLAVEINREQIEKGAGQDINRLYRIVTRDNQPC